MSRPVVAFDTETALIRPGCLAPELICVTWQTPGQPARIQDRGEAKRTVASWLLDGAVLVGHNVAYDMAVLAEAYPDLRVALFRAYEEDRVTDTMLRQKLLDIAGGVYKGRAGTEGRWVSYDYSLETTARRIAGMQLQKDAWRLSYGEFAGVPMTEWPARAREVQAAARATIAGLEVQEEYYPKADPRRKALGKTLEGLRLLVEGSPDRCAEYPLDDARATLAIYQCQAKHREYLDDEYRQARGAWALHLSSAWGIRTEPEGVERLRTETEAEVADYRDTLLEAGLLRADDSRDTKAAKARMVAACAEVGLPVPRTASHDPGDPERQDCRDGTCDHVSLDGDACERTEDPVLVAYAGLSTAKKVLANDVEAMAKGVNHPLHTRYGLAETGRATSSAPNIMNVTKRPGIRECFVARDGYLFAEADYPQLELYTLAQYCVSTFGKSVLADVLNAGLDPHLEFGARIVGLPYEEAGRARKDPTHPRHGEVKKARDLAKAFNFGKPGGLGAPKFQLFAKKTYGIELSLEQIKAYSATWFATFPEMTQHFGRANQLCDNERNLADVVTLFTNRHRGRATYCAACNNPFQALGSDCAKEAAWQIAKAQYVTPGHDLYGTRTVAFVHDEFILEVPEDLDTADRAARALARTMVEAANKYLPDVPIALDKMEPLLMKRWSKNAATVLNNEGKIIPWQP